MKFSFTAQLLFLIILTSCTYGKSHIEIKKDTIKYNQGKLLYADDFDNNTDQWFSEFEIPEFSKVSIENNKLDLIAKKTLETKIDIFSETKFNKLKNYYHGNT
jgi:hypothetical protein